MRDIRQWSRVRDWVPSLSLEGALMWGTLPDSGAGADAGTRELKMWEEWVVHGSPGLAEGPAQGSADSAEGLSAPVSQGNAWGRKGFGVILVFRDGVCLTVI